jgi:uncharacterized RDD family membrane protein YckC
LSACANCGHENPAGARFCGSCGAELPQPGPAAADFQTSTATPLYFYAGFWRRFGAAVIDIIITAIFSQIVTSIPGAALPALIVFLTPWAYYVILTGTKGQTVGKMALGIKVVDANGDIPGLGRAALREIIGKTISGLVLGLGYFWIIWDPNKQGWHDKIASTHVIHA